MHLSVFQFMQREEKLSSFVPIWIARSDGIWLPRSRSRRSAMLQDGYSSVMLRVIHL
jgi:hypothetical protein